MSRKTISVGIPAYNEEGNIGHLLSDLNKQETRGFRFAKIIVYCDGCSDKTEEIAKSFGKKVEVIVSKARNGVALGINRLMESAQSDVLVILNADVRIRDAQFLEKITAPVLRNEADLTSVGARELAAKSFLGRAIVVSNVIKKDVYENYKGGDNVYTCHGQARALSKRLYKRISIKSNIGEDSYSYLYALSRNFKYVFVKEANIYYKVPEAIRDHVKQSMRFYGSKRELEKYFDAGFVKEQFSLPAELLFASAFKFLLAHPMQVISYAFLLAATRIYSFFASDIGDLWEVSKSTKYLEATNE